ncbi:MAG TPA: T9SS type A sorting domain-containing protein, partial [Flavobacterium sp.]|nr:T9SS type A sorting domain-containing protein [Flavobacterium sp.]
TLPSYLGVDDFISSKFNVFPNPLTDMLTISNAENRVIEELTVYDTNGKIVKSQKGKTANETQLNIEDLASGVYMLHIKTEEGVAVKKIVKK